MRVTLWTLGVFVLAQTVTRATCMTNKEFYLWTRRYATDIEVANVYDDVSDEIDVGEVITLPGSPDDEIDIGYVIEKLVIRTREELEPVSPNLVWQQHHQRNLNQGPFKSGCQRDSCTCCVEHTFKFNNWATHIRFPVTACLEVTYLPRKRGFELTVAINHRRLYRKQISLRHPPGLCFAVPGLRSYSRVCIQLYGVNTTKKSGCARLTGFLDFKLKKFHVNLRLGCFTIPVMDTDAFLLLTRDHDFLPIKRL